MSSTSDLDTQIKKAKLDLLQEQLEGQKLFNALLRGRILGSSSATASAIGSRRMSQLSAGGSTAEMVSAFGTMGSVAGTSNSIGLGSAMHMLHEIQYGDDEEAENRISFLEQENRRLGLEETE